MHVVVAPPPLLPSLSGGCKLQFFFLYARPSVCSKKEEERKHPKLLLLLPLWEYLNN